MRYEFVHDNYEVHKLQFLVVVHHFKEDLKIKVLTLWCVSERHREAAILSMNTIRSALDSPKSELSKAFRIKSISNFLAFISLIWKRAVDNYFHFMPWKTTTSWYWHDFNQRYRSEQIRYGLNSKCVGKLRLWVIQRTSHRIHWQDSGLPMSLRNASKG